MEDQSQSNSCCANAVAGAYEYINKRGLARGGFKCLLSFKGSCNRICKGNKCNFGVVA